MPDNFSISAPAAVGGVRAQRLRAATGTKHYDPAVPMTLAYRETTRPDLLLARAWQHPERPAVISYNREEASRFREAV